MMRGKFVHDSVKHRFIYVQQEFDRIVMDSNTAKNLTH